MLKPASLRAHLTAATPELRLNPDKLTLFLTNGRLVAAGANSISFENRYTLKLVVLDYASHPDAIFVPLLAWLRVHQPEICDNPELRERSLRFEAEYLNNESIDLSIDIDLSERVVVKAGADPDAAETERRYVIEHAAEPPLASTVQQQERYSVWVKDELIANWDFIPARY